MNSKTKSATQLYTEKLALLKEGELGLLRTHAFQGLDESLEGFDLFTGLWWPLMQTSPKTPRREVAWLIAKLYAFRPFENSSGETLALQLKRCQPFEEKERKRFREKFDELLTTSLDSIETPLRWALNEIAVSKIHEPKLDWTKLTNDLSAWEKETIRLRWTKELVDKNLNSNL